MKDHEMDHDEMSESIKTLEKFQAIVEPRIERLEKKSDEHSGKLQNVSIELAELRVEFNAFAREIKGIVMNVKWWIMAAIAAVGMVAKWL